MDAVIVAQPRTHTSPPADPAAWLTVSQVAARLNVSRSTVRAEIARTVLPALRVRRTWRIAASQVAAYVTRHSRRVIVPPAPLPGRRGTTTRTTSTSASRRRAAPALPAGWLTREELREAGVTTTRETSAR